MANAPILPGGQIIGGMGGRIYTGPMGNDPNYFANLNAQKALGLNADPGYIEVEQWAISRQWINAECTHSGTYGAITRRNVAYDWQFQCSLPLDQANTFPDRLLGVLPQDIAVNPAFVNAAIAFFLGDVTINVEAVAMKMTQRFYFAPMCIIRSCNPVLNASRDVIRYQVTGEGNSRLYLYPDEKTDCTNYINYLKTRGWWT